MPPAEILEYDSPTVVGVDENDPDGYIPLNLLQTGIEVRIPVWPLPSPPGKTDTLIVEMKRNGIVEFSSTTYHLTPISETEFFISIGPQYLITDGVVEVSYTTKNYLQNPHPSFPRTLTIDHTPIPSNLTEVKFPAANLSGYLNCTTQPPIWEGVEVKVPPLPGFCRPGDICAVEWLGYQSLNDSGPPIPATYKRINTTLTALQITNGFSVTIEPFRPHLEPMINKASALANYTLYRGSRRIGISAKNGVKIDRIIPGESQPCGP
ncbi:hypothetical protein BK653_01410 [Pseudomonas brassicacearum]|uniref:hypothetical protein n=1 Tax=Pseudomonas brassicacearum TaxID=930166 RepID=UPI000F4A49D8|nr:hypothetical protein [Pseudomonas brassicacearum]ROM70577.1 hypothetical protein BK653_01410 [Pseudomonas brassicacearum]